ncbi:MAG: hypothetical protein AAGA85_06920 [Bacteroidota bacterium]
MQEVHPKKEASVLADLDWLTHKHLTLLVEDPFGQGSPLRLKDLAPAQYQAIPLLNQVRFLMDVLKSGAVRLSDDGELPHELVEDIYEERFMLEVMMEDETDPSEAERDLLSVKISQWILGFAGLSQVKGNKLVLTKTGGKMLDQHSLLLKTVLTTYGTLLPWSKFDGFGDNEVGQHGYGFSLLLLSNYGQELRPQGFYSEKYFAAFPQLLAEGAESRFGSLENLYKCYHSRTFDRFVDDFGLVEFHADSQWSSEKEVAKTPLFDELIKCKPVFK